MRTFTSTQRSIEPPPVGSRCDGVGREVTADRSTAISRRAFSRAADAANRARGRAMIEAALSDFRALEMVLHTKLAEQFLVDGH